MRRWSLLAVVIAACAGSAACVAGAAAGSVRAVHAAPGGGARPEAANAAAREQTADQQLRHALARLTFGARPGDVERVRAVGVDRWIARQLDPASIPDPRGDALLAHYPTQALPPDALLRDYTPAAVLRRALRADRAPTRADSLAYRAAARRARQVGGELASLKVARAVASERQLDEVMVDFWESHFNVYAAKGPLMRHYLVAYSRDAIRPHALGRFRDLLGAVAKSPAMLTYLDNARSVADSGRPVLAAGRAPRRAGPRAPRGVNENYARELLELHTLGVDGGYTQRDVAEVARAFTGWTVRPPAAGAAGAPRGLARAAQPLGEGSLFVPRVHDAGAKLVLGHALPAGRGVEDGEAVLDIVARHPATARLIATKLARRFVSDTPPAALVARAAATFTRTDGDVREVVRTIVTSPEFFSRAAWRAKVKSPLEVVVSALRATGAPPDPTPRTAAIVARLGQPLYLHQAPDGWPDTGGEWINGGAILGRINFGLAVAAERVPGARRAAWPWPPALDGAPRARQVDAVAASLFGGDLSPETREVLIAGRNPLATGDGAAAPVPPAETLGGLRQVVGLALGAPEFQRR